MYIKSAAAAFLIIFTPLQLSAATINTGETSGAYHTKFCPALQNGMKDQKIELSCKPSFGSISNINKVEQAISEFGFSQFDIFAKKTEFEKGNMKLKLVRDDIERECLFFITKNKLFNNYGDISASAAYLNFIMPPKGSGSAATFKILQDLDTKGLGAAASVTYAANTEDAITGALSSDDNVTLIVHHPDPNSQTFKLINANGGLFIPAIAREILGAELNGSKLYRAEETPVSNPKWHKSGQKVVTACTPIVLFAGKPELISDTIEKNAHTAAINIIEQTPANKLRPVEGWFSWIWSGSKKLSAKSVEAMVDAAEKAKKATSPYVEKAKDASEPYVEKAVDASKDLYDATKEKTKEAIEASKPAYEKAKEKTLDAIEASKPAVEKAKEVGKSMLDKAGNAIKTMKDKAVDQTNKENTAPENAE